MSNQFTPGPWPLETVVTQVGICHKIGAFPALYRREKITYACVYDDGGTLKHPDPQLLANARLIAAAPALYEALATLRTWLIAPDLTPDTIIEMRETVAAALALVDQSTEVTS